LGFRTPIRPFLAPIFTPDKLNTTGYLTLDETIKTSVLAYRLGGLMAPSPSVVALPWYARGEYPALLKLFSDPEKLPDTYDAWLKRAEGVERQMQKAGFSVVRIWIRPIPFAAWCKARNVLPDQAARLNFVNEAKRELSARQ
jgi:hypothetical protein